MTLSKVTTFILISFIMGLTTTACGPQKNGTESILVRSYRLIDENRMDEAITLLTQEQKQNPSEQVNVTLASAYAKKSGLSIREITKSFSQAQAIASVDTSSLTESPNYFDQNIGQLGKLTTVNSQHFRFFSVVPKIEESKIIYLEYACKLLNSTQLTDPANHIYAAIIKIVLARSYLSLSKPQMSVVSSLDDFKKPLLKSSRFIASATGNFLAAMPEKQKEIAEFQTQLNSLIDQLALTEFNVSFNQGMQEPNFAAAYQKFLESIGNGSQQIGPTDKK